MNHSLYVSFLKNQKMHNLCFNFLAKQLKYPRSFICNNFKDLIEIFKSS